jgi:hypothetical protein
MPELITRCLGAILYLGLISILAKFLWWCIIRPPTGPGDSVSALLGIFLSIALIGGLCYLAYHGFLGEQPYVTIMFSSGLATVPIGISIVVIGPKKVKRAVWGN